MKRLMTLTLALSFLAGTFTMFAQDQKTEKTEKTKKGKKGKKKAAKTDEEKK